MCLAAHAAPSHRGPRDPGPRPRRPLRTVPSPGVPRWFYGILGAIAFLGIATVALVVVLSRPKEGPRVALPDAAPTASQTASEPSLPSPVAAMEARVHEVGEESPELRNLIDVQGRLATRCRNNVRECGRGWTSYASEAIDAVDAGTLVPSGSDGPLSAWLHKVKIPKDFPLKDQPTVKGDFDYNARNTAGRQRFQAKLFNCGAYADIFDAALAKYGAPSWLIAVVYQESGCDPSAGSPVGAKGLWQFMPESWARDTAFGWSTTSSTSGSTP